MNKKKAGCYPGPEVIYARNVARGRATIKNAIIIATLWRCLPIPLAEWLIRRLHLENV